MANSQISTTEGSGKNVATYSISETTTKEIQRTSLNDSSGVELTANFGSLTETAPATDTASSGLNGRLQRIAQRLTSLIALLPTALGAGGGIKVDGSGTALPVSGTGTFATQATLQTQTDTTMVGGVNIKEINAVAPLMGNGGTGTGSQRVTIASDNSVLPGVGAGATGSAVPANASYGGAIAKTALPTAATDANLVGAMSDKFGRLVVIPGTIRDLVGTQTTTVSSSTSETTIVTAGGAGIFNDIELIVVSNTSATAARLDFRDATSGSVLFSLYVPAGDTRGFSLGGGSVIPQTTAANNWTAQSSASVADLRIYVVFQKNK